jgi:hypothetical protein
MSRASTIWRVTDSGLVGHQVGVLGGAGRVDFHETRRERFAGRLVQGCAGGPEATLDELGDAASDHRPDAGDRVPQLIVLIEQSVQSGRQVRCGLDQGAVQVPHDRCGMPYGQFALRLRHLMFLGQTV